MLETVRTFGAFLWGFACLLVAMGLEAVGQVSIYGGTWLIEAAQSLSEHALRVGVWD